MKSKFLICFFAAISICSVAIANNCSDTIPDPEFTSQPYFFDKNNNKLIQLEFVMAKMKSKAKAMGYGGFSSGYEMQGKNSDVIITSKDNIEFVMTGGNRMMDPSQTLSLYKLKSSKNSREAITMQSKGMFGKSNDDDNNKINFNVKKDGDKYVFVPAQKLERGEYGFIDMMSMNAGGRALKAYCFSMQ